MVDFLNAEGRFQVNRAIDAHVIATNHRRVTTVEFHGWRYLGRRGSSRGCARPDAGNPTVLAVDPTTARDPRPVDVGERDAVPVRESRRTGSASPLWGLDVVEVAGLASPLLIDVDMLGRLYLGTVRLDVDPFSQFSKNLSQPAGRGEVLDAHPDANGAVRVLAPLSSEHRVPRRRTFGLPHRATGVTGRARAACIPCPRSPGPAVPAAPVSSAAVGTVAQPTRARTAAVSGDQRIGTFDRVGSIGRCGVERLSEREKEEIVRLSAMGLPSRLIGQADRSAPSDGAGVISQRLRRPAVPEPVRSPLRLSLREREEISRGLAGGRVAAVDRTAVGSVAVDDRRGRSQRNGGRAPLSGLRGGQGGGASSCVARSRRSWRRVHGCERWWRRSSSCGGRRSRSRVGWWTSSPTIRRCACRTRRSICRCSCSPAVRCARN